MKIVPTLLALCATAALCAQTPAPQPDSALSARVERLETKNSKWSRVLEHLPRISGYLQTGYEWSDNSSTFFIKRIRLSLAGDIVRDRLDYLYTPEGRKPDNPKNLESLEKIVDRA